MRAKSLRWYYLSVDILELYFFHVVVNCICRTSLYNLMMLTSECHSLDMDRNFLFLLPPTSIYLFKVNNKNTRKLSKICSKLTIKIPEERLWRRSGVFIVNFEHISQLLLSIAEFEQVNVCWGLLNSW